jgi:hypothetical protein
MLRDRAATSISYPNGHENESKPLSRDLWIPRPRGGVVSSLELRRRHLPDLRARPAVDRGAHSGSYSLGGRRASLRMEELGIGVTGSSIPPKAGFEYAKAPE